MPMDMRCSRYEEYGSVLVVLVVAVVVLIGPCLVHHKV